MPKRRKTDKKQTRRQPETSQTAGTFRRYRTLISPKVAVEASSRSKKRSLVVTRRRVMGLLVVFGLACVLATIVLFQFVGVVKIASDDPAIQADKVYQATVDDYYRAHPLERLRFLLDKERFSDVLISNHHEISGYKIEPIKIGEIKLSLTFRRPTASWSINSQQQYVDESGIIFNRNYYQEPTVTIIDRSGLHESSSQDAVASQSFLSFTGQLVGLGERYDLPVASVTIPKGAIRNVEVKFAKKPYKVMMNTGSEVGEQFEDAKRSIAWVDKHKSGVKNIDVRVNRRAAYR